MIMPPAVCTPANAARVVRVRMTKAHAGAYVLRTTFACKIFVAAIWLNILSLPWVSRLRY